MNMALTNDDVHEIVRILDASHYDEFHIETRHFKLSLRRSGTAAGWTQETRTLSSPNVELHKDKPAQVSRTEPEDSDADQGDDRVGLTDIHPPLIGTFYRSPKPGAPPFVEVGSRVEADTVVGIIETMKLMNPVTARVHGVVAEICVSDGGFVETDSVLMRLCQETS